VQNKVLDLKLLIILCISFISTEMQAQLGFCQGNSGDPIFTETFGTGTNYGPQLPAGTTTYNFVNFDSPQDGQYTVGPGTFSFGWNMPSDHTPGDVNGKALIVNASFNAGEFYKTNINGLCENTTYEFSSWLMNILPSSGCGGGGIPVNVSFEIWDITDTNLLASGNTGSIFSTSVPFWNQYGLVFQTLPAQTSVILKMINNGVGGCGNDLAIDDIVFKSCGDSIDVEDTGNNNLVSLCSTQTPYSNNITAVPDNVVFNNHFYQWQTSTDGIIWNDIPGETADNLNITNITTTTLYRAKVAEIAVNLSNEDCITFSDVYQIIITQAPAQPTLQCWQTATFDDTICDWIVTGTQPPAPTNLECWETTTFNDTTCVWDITGTQPIQPIIECWETATFNNTTCAWDITGTQPPAPTNLECWEIITFNNTTCVWDVSGTQPLAPTNLECWETTTFNNTTCTWDITGTQPVQPTIECWETATFNNTTCIWDVSGAQPLAPTNLECWETATFNNATCIWDITGTQPAQPTLECWETTVFNNMTCTWDISGTQPLAPMGLDCWEIATFNNNTCTWEVSGSQPLAPTNLECWQTTSFNNTTCVWDIIGSQPAIPAGLDCWETTTFNTTTCTWEVSGSQPSAPTNLECWQTTEFNTTTCVWDILGTQPIEERDEFRDICENEELILDPNSSISNPNYQWDSGETTPTLTIQDAGIYSVEVTDGCFTEIITFNIIAIETPVIESVESIGSTIVVNLVTDGDYLYSVNGIDYQFSNIFPNMQSRLYTIFVKSNECDILAMQEHFHFYIQKFMTPNDDGKNDFFSLNLEQFFTSSEVYIFNRYGKLLFSAKNRNVNWDGTFNGNSLPASDYWYRIVLDGQEFKGHFSLRY
jgi:gliding motility-associated-like protein